MIGLLSILSSVQFSGANLAKQEKENNESTIDYFIDKKEGYSTFRMNNKNLSVNYPISSYEVGSPRTLNLSSHIVKRSLYRLNDIPLEILTLTQSSRYNYQLRNTLDTIFRLSHNSLEYKDAEGGLKDLFLLMKCVQIMKVFVIKTENMNLDVFSKGKYMLESLINIGEALKNPYYKNIFKKFKSNLASDLSTMKIMELPDGVIEGIHQGKQLNYELIKFSNHDMNNFFFGEKRRLLKNFLSKSSLSKNSVKNYKPTSIERVNTLIDYISGEGSENRMGKVANILLMPIGKYEKSKKKQVSEAEKMSAISDYMNYEILGIPLESWLLKEAKKMNESKSGGASYGKIENKLNHIFDTKSTKLRLNESAQFFYKNNILGKSIPTFLLPLSSIEHKKIKRMSFLQPQWGAVHAGAMFLNALSVDVKNLTLADIEDVGMILDILIRNDIVPKEYIRYFKLPAFLYYFNIEDRQEYLSEMNEDDVSKIFFSYFENTRNWMVDNNPFTRLFNLANGWKSRPQLARALLKDNNVNEEMFDDYLNAHGELKVITDGSYVSMPNIIILPNIDEVFNKQNSDLADASYSVDKLNMSHLFNSSFAEEDIDFIKKSLIVSVAVEFNARENIYSVPLPPSARMGMQDAKALIYNVPDYIDVFQCKLNGEERIYALEFSKNTGVYQVKRVDYNREEMLSLLDDSFVPSRDKDYKLKVYKRGVLKNEGKTLLELINNLAGSHRNKILTELYKKGYEKTFNEKVSDFLLSIIPFYTCISESIKGNKEEAIPACVIDVLNLLPFFGQVSHVGGKFAFALGRSTSIALRYGAQQATFSEILMQTTKKLPYYGFLTMKDIPPQVFRNSCVGFLRGIDPGFELFALGGKEGVRAMGKMLSMWKNKSKGMKRLAEVLDKNGREVKGNPKIKSSGNDAVRDLINKDVFSKIPTASGDIIKREIGGSNYVQYYITPMENGISSKSLVVSAHGGFVASDTIAPVVVLPSDITIKMLTPHGTYLEDPGLEAIVNRNSKFTAYATFTHGKLTSVKFTPQNENKGWLKVDDYDPNHTMNVQGREDGLQNYRHYKFEGESDEHISNVLIKNHALAKKGEAKRTDILTVNSRVRDVGDTSLQKASVQVIMDLDRAGKLVNGNGERYNTIIFSHCRNDFLKSEQAISTYQIEPVGTDVTQSKGAKISNVVVTVLSRKDATSPLEVRHYSVGHFLFQEVIPYSENE
ncbi:hypothetical protein IW01_00590 [Pectobacterium brasiliense]|nr:hypothetical protein IW01_00590 [Pectobacterium brasiliense]